MSKIDELIAKLSSVGVKYKELGHCATVVRGKRVTKSQLKDDKKYPVISGGFKPLGYFDEYNREPETITIAQYGSAGYLDWQKEKFWANDVCYSIYPNEKLLNNRFLYFVLSSQQNFIYSLKTNAIPAHLPQSLLEKIQIPIPPLPVQEEIVRILDKFTLLEAELEAELEARTRQYEHYRNELLSFEGKNVEWKTLGDIGEFIRGSGLQKTDFRESGVGCIHYGQIYTYYGTSAKETKSFVSEELATKLRKAKKGDLVIAGVSENIEDVCKAVVWLGEEDICISGDSSAFRHNQNPKYIGYLFQTDRFLEFKKKYAQGAKVTRLRSGSLPTFTIPIPTLEEQERIVTILDKFDALVNDIATGLPAEIQARKQQYEYYRGKLLTFEPVVVAQ